MRDTDKAREGGEEREGEKREDRTSTGPSPRAKGREKECRPNPRLHLLSIPTPLSLPSLHREEEWRACIEWVQFNHEGLREREEEGKGRIRIICKEDSALGTACRMVPTLHAGGALETRSASPPGDAVKLGRGAAISRN